MGKISKNFIPYKGFPHKQGPIQIGVDIAHPYAIFLCSLGESLVGHLTSTHAKSRKMSVHKMSLQPLIYQIENYLFFWNEPRQQFFGPHMAFGSPGPLLP